MAGHGHIPHGLRAVFAQVFVTGVLLPTAAPAQLVPPTSAPAQTGYYLAPSLSVAEVYDDNVFFTTSPRTHDFLTRISPDLKAGYQSVPLTVAGGYTFDSETYSRHSELTSIQIRQRGLLEVKVMPDPVLTLSVSGAYFQTKTPTEFNLTTGLAARRVLAERYTANPGFTYRFDPLTTVKGDYTFSKDLLAGGVTIDSHIENLTLDYRLSPRDTVGPGYVGRQFAFAGFPALTIANPQVWWPYQLGAQPLYTLGVTVAQGSTQFNSTSETFGIRTVTSYLTGSAALPARGNRACSDLTDLPGQASAAARTNWASSWPPKSLW